MADWEVGYLTAHLTSVRNRPQDARFRIVTVGLSQAPVTTMGGLRLVPEIAVDLLDPTDSAMLVLPGGETWGTPATEPFVQAARRFLEARVPVAAICGATYGLAAAGLLDQRRHTSNDPGFLAASGYAGADHYVERAGRDRRRPGHCQWRGAGALRAGRLRAARGSRSRDGRLLVQALRRSRPGGYYELMAAEAG